MRGGTIEGAKVVPVTLAPAPDEDIVRLRVTSDARGPDGIPLDFEKLPPLEVGDFPELVESVSPDASPPRAAAPVVLNGRVDSPSDRDRFTIIVTPGQRLQVEFEAAYQVYTDRANGA